MEPMRHLIIAICISFISSTAFAELKAEVDATSIAKGQSFSLTLTQEGNTSSGVPDLSPLQNEFAILGTGQQMNYTIINGQAQSNNQWSITLKPLKAGILTIPAIQLGKESSSPITIHVEENAKPEEMPNSDSRQNVLLLTSANEKKPYINQQITYNVKLYNNKRLLNAEYQGPQADNALVISLGEAKRYQTNYNNSVYVVEEQQYAIYPQKSGPLSIISPTFNALVYDYNPERVSLQDKPVHLEVLPIPKQYQGKNWLPATQVSLTEQYENNSQTLSQGSTLIRTITLEGVSVPAQLLPTLDFTAGDAFNVYPEKGEENNQLKQGNLVGKIQYKVTYLFDKSGKVTIPELTLPWYNTQTGQEAIARLAPRTLDISPSAAAPAPIAAPATPASSEPAESPALPQLASKNSMTPWLLALVFAIAWVLTLLLWWWQRGRKITTSRLHKKALVTLDKACKANDPHQARDAVLQWASIQWPEATIRNLNDIAERVRDIHVKKQLQTLSQLLYKPQDSAGWRGDEFLRAILSVKKNHNHKKPKQGGLPPINPFGQ